MLGALLIKGCAPYMPITSDDVNFIVREEVAPSAYVYWHGDNGYWYGKYANTEEADFFLAQCSRDQNSAKITCTYWNARHVEAQEWLRRQQLEGGPEGGAHTPPSNLLQ
jgi:hypothetical protein